jgi:hypothetical protein
VHHTSRTSTHRKAKKSYTLSVESVEFLERLRKKRRAGSASAVLEQILQAARREESEATLGRAVSDFYDSLSREETREQSEWGEFSWREFSHEDA